MRAAKVDSTHAAIRTELRDLGWLVEDVFRLPHFVDMLAYHRKAGVWLVDAKGTRTRTTDDQTRLAKDGWPLVFLRSADEARLWSTSVLR